MQNAHQARISWSFFPLVWRTAEVAADGDGRSAYVGKDTGQLATEVLRGEGAGDQGQEKSRAERAQGETHCSILRLWSLLKAGYQPAPR